MNPSASTATITTSIVSSFQVLTGAALSPTQYLQDTVPDFGSNRLMFTPSSSSAATFTLVNGGLETNDSFLTEQDQGFFSEWIFPQSAAFIAASQLIVVNFIIDPKYLRCYGDQYSEWKQRVASLRFISASGFGGNCRNGRANFWR